MIIHAPKRLLMLAALLCTTMPSLASEPMQPAPPISCKKPEYPERAQKAEAEGITVLGFLVRADGTVRDTVVLSSTGSRDLDRAAELALSRCLFERVAKVDDAVDLWVRMVYVWHLTDDDYLLRAKHKTAVAAGNGNVAARYHLSLLLSTTAKTDADREKALVVLRSAAELGHAHAQYDLGQRYEKGEGVTVDPDEALRWYRKSAAQDDPLAKQRLTLGILGS
ncbi:TonB family protein [Massilia niabensis]|uniref:TonB family protein n=1 Tax=Massilia niabensis TaxID=544910 RepID=A0ABW0LBX9_9BURK